MLLNFMLKYQDVSKDEKFKLHTIKQYKNFFFGKKVIVTGHTGFKGS